MFFPWSAANLCSSAAPSLVSYQDPEMVHGCCSLAGTGTGSWDLYLPAVAQTLGQAAGFLSHPFVPAQTLLREWELRVKGASGLPCGSWVPLWAGRLRPTLWILPGSPGAWISQGMRQGVHSMLSCRTLELSQGSQDDLRSDFSIFLHFSPNSQLPSAVPVPTV